MHYGKVFLTFMGFFLPHICDNTLTESEKCMHLVLREQRYVTIGGISVPPCPVTPTASQHPWPQRSTDMIMEEIPVPQTETGIFVLDPGLSWGRLSSMCQGTPSTWSQ